MSQRMLLVAMLWCWLPCDFSAQTTATNFDPVESLLFGDSLHYAFDVEAALSTFEQIIEHNENNIEALWKAARECVSMGLLVDGTDNQNEWFRRGEAYAQRAADLEPENLTVLYWLLAAKGRRAVQSDALTTAKLATEVYDLSNWILERDTLHAGATHALGVLNYEVMKLSRVKRFIAQRILGGRALSRTSWEKAEDFLSRATELNPEFTLYWLDLGKLFLRRDDPNRAREAFIRATQTELIEPTDQKFQDRASRYLDEMDQR